MADMTAADPVAVVLGWLRQHPRVLDEFGGANHVSGVYEAPWPRLRVTTAPGGILDDLLWSNAHEVTLETVDHPDGRLGKAELWRLAVVALTAVKDLPGRDVGPADPVVSLVRPSGTVGWSPLETGQGRWTVGVSLVIRPPLI